MSKKIKNFFQTYFSASELISFSRRLINTVKKFLSDDPTGLNLVRLLTESMNVLVKSFERTKKSKYTNALFVMDKKRYRIFLYIKKISKAFSLHPTNFKKQNAGKEIVKCINIHLKNISKMGYAERSNKLNYFINELNTDEYKESLEITGLSGWIKKLADSQKEFEKIYAERVETEHTENNVSLHDAMNACVDSIELLLGHINAKSAIDNIAFEELVESVNEIIEDSQTVAKTRKTRGKNGENVENIVKNQESGVS